MKDQSVSCKRKREPLTNICYGYLSKGSICGPSRNGLPWILDGKILLLSTTAKPTWTENSLINHITQNLTQEIKEIDFCYLTESKIELESWIEAAKAATGVQLFKFDFSQVKTWLSQITQHSNFLKELMSSALDLNTLSLLSNKTLNVSWKEFQQVLFQIIASLPNKITTIRVFYSRILQLESSVLLKKLDENFGRIDKFLSNCVFEIDIARFKQLQNKAFVLFLTGHHPRTGTRSLLRTLASHPLFDPNIYRIIGKSAGISWKAKAGLLELTQSSTVDNPESTTQNGL